MKSTWTIGCPWRVDGTGMSPNLLLMAKLLVLVFIRGGAWARMSDPFLPFFPWLDLIRSQGGWFGHGLHLMFLMGAAAVLMNVRPRIGCLLTGAAILLWQFGVTPEFRNHIFICGCLLFLAGCHGRTADPWLIRWQFALIYAGAALNKLLQADWWTGQFLFTWLTAELPAAGFRLTAKVVPPLLLAKLLSWFTMVAETALAVCFCRRQWVRPAVWMVLLLHGGMFVFLMGYRFGHFIEDILVGLIAFLSWPEQPLEIRTKGPADSLFPRLLRLLNPAASVHPTIARESAVWLETIGSEGHPTNGLALRSVLLFSPGVYFVLFAGDWALEVLLGQWDLYRFITVSFALTLLACFAPAKWLTWPTFWRKSRPSRPGVGL